MEKRKEKSRRDRSRSHSGLTKSSFERFRSIDRVPRVMRKKKRGDVSFFFLFFSRRSDTLESSNAPSAFLGSIHQIVASFTAARFLRFDRAYVALGEDPLRIRMHARACSIMRLRDRGRRLEECWSKRIINAILRQDNTLIQWRRGSLMEVHEPLHR